MAKTKDEVREEALTILRKHRCGGAGISMGVGKTRLGLEHFQLVVNKILKDRNRMAKCLIVAPKLVILEGWKKEAAKWNMEHLIDGMNFTTYRSLTKMNTNEYDVIYLDECHSLKQSHDYWLSHFGGYILGLTGTVPKHQNSEKYKIIQKYCPIRYEYLTDEAVDDKLLNDYNIIVHLLSLGQTKDFKVELKTKDRDPKKRKVMKSWFTSETENYAYWTSAINSESNFVVKSKLSVLRMKAMQKYTSKEQYAKKLLEQATDKCLLFANEQQQADKLCKHSYHSNNKDSESNMEKFEDGRINKMSCVLQLSEGANMLGLKEAILMHAYANNRKAAQRIGRVLRLSPEDMATVHVLCYKDTVDVEWVKEALSEFNQEKIEWYDPDIF